MGCECAACGADKLRSVDGICHPAADYFFFYFIHDIHTRLGVRFVRVCGIPPSFMLLRLLVERRGVDVVVVVVVQMEVAVVVVRCGWRRGRCSGGDRSRVDLSRRRPRQRMDEGETASGRPFPPLHFYGPLFLVTEGNENMNLPRSRETVSPMFRVLYIIYYIHALFQNISVFIDFFFPIIFIFFFIFFYVLVCRRVSGASPPSTGDYDL